MHLSFGYTHFSFAHTLLNFFICIYIFHFAHTLFILLIRGYTSFLLILSIYFSFGCTLFIRVYTFNFVHTLFIRVFHSGVHFSFGFAHTLFIWVSFGYTLFNFAHTLFIWGAHTLLILCLYTFNFCPYAFHSGIHLSTFI